MTKAHTNKTYGNELRQLRDRMLLIASRVEKMIGDSLCAFTNQDRALAKEIILYDKNIDREEIIIDRQCIEMLAQRQPLAQDLRFIVSVLKMVTYWERLGDLAVKISERVIKLTKASSSINTLPIEQLAREVQFMLSQTIQAFARADAKLATQVLSHDDTIDDMYYQQVKNLINQMIKDPADIEHTLHLLSIIRWLERMGDHCTNLAELIIFMAKGEDVRHQHQQLEQNNSLF